MSPRKEKKKSLDLFIPLINVGSARHVSPLATISVFSGGESRFATRATRVRGFFHAKAPEADAAGPITSDLKPEVLGTANTFTFVNGDLLLPDERSLIPWTYAFNFSLKLQSNKLPARIFLCQMFSLWWIWSTLGPAFELHPLPVLPQTLLFSFKLISSFPPKKWIHLIHSSTWREASLPHWPCCRTLMERMTHCWFLFCSLWGTRHDKNHKSQELAMSCFSNTY